MHAEQQSNSGGNKSSKKQPPFYEWVAAGAGLVLVAFVIGFILFKAVTVTPQPPAVTVDLLGVRERDGRYLAEIQLYNSGSTTASNVPVTGVLRQDGNVIETSSARFDFVPSQSYVSGGLFFSHDPRRYALTIRAEGYQRP